MKVKPFKSKLTRKLRDMAEVSTVHAIPNISRTKYTTVRLMWILFFLGSFGLCSYIIIRSIVDYFKYETTVSIRRYQELPADFPAITFCNINPFNEAHADTLAYLNATLDRTEFSNCLSVTNGDAIQECTGSSDTNSILDDSIDQLKRIVANELSANESQTLGFDLFRDMFVSCIFNNKPCNNANNFTSFWSPNYGNCYTFNSGKTQAIQKTSGSGPDSGLRLELTVKPPNMQSRFLYKTGLYLVNHNQSEAFFSLNNGINIPTGFDTFIGVERVFSKKLSGKFSNCIDELKSSSSYQQKLFGFFSFLNVNFYRQELCFKVCLQDKLIDKCNCSDTTTPKLRGAQYCSSSAEIKCLDDFIASSTTLDSNVLCESACPPECNLVEYDLKLDSATFPSLSYLRYFTTDNDTIDQFPNDEKDYESFGRTGFLRIRVNYENSYYTVINESPTVTEEALLGNIGGQLGLFIGMGVLSFIEIFEWILESIFLYSEHRKEIKQAKRVRKMGRHTFITTVYQ